MNQPRDAEPEIDHLARYRDGDRHAFTVLVEHYQEAVRSFFYRLCWDRDQADDLAQDLFIKLMERSHGYRPTGNLSGFLWRVATNLWIDTYRGQRLRHRLERPIEAVMPHLRGRSPKPIEGVVLDEERQRVAAALSGLSEQHRLVIELAVNQGMPYITIAELLGIPVGTVKSRMHNAIARLQAIVASASSQGAVAGSVEGGRHD